ncbi:hypothetical protein ACMGDK_11550 [Chryseobacterium sp. DT-3]|uniref:hypothetical protein n=1 Tax=Chryseobacterium sp. DT-3 TaxID=3396164 RepID=UPI003F194385
MKKLNTNLDFAQISEHNKAMDSYRELFGYDCNYNLSTKDINTLIEEKLNKNQAKSDISNIDNQHDKRNIQEIKLEIEEKKKEIIKCLALLLVATVFFILKSYIFMLIWNEVIHKIFGITEISFNYAMLLIIISGMLFGSNKYNSLKNLIENKKATSKIGGTGM